MNFKLNIGALTTTIKEYKNLVKILNEQKQNINNAISLLPANALFLCMII